MCIRNNLDKLENYPDFERKHDWFLGVADSSSNSG